uniref:Uncharacterized protein n=1 Tax=Chromera velia CCMP2878 TaxID=1169474 RepID=A0A0G4GDS1_9ALVE|eukprot:Cvel_21430.t1-p1 / transcript=Cvel_21430.t1 / gene=Cvel_21430 / organism=Chromera_velia_CCMP2878 / gene_product=hypothetical protein / transcript_product=hypothetical protein / location=Cvel_scaffold2009:4233-8756(+) / protein_length=556 / sequence_SO=supercontig / SO=protein_coding / is_pseudo=false
MKAAQSHQGTGAGGAFFEAGKWRGLSLQELRNDLSALHETMAMSENLLGVSLSPEEETEESKERASPSHKASSKSPSAEKKKKKTAAPPSPSAVPPSRKQSEAVRRLETLLRDRKSAVDFSLLMHSQKIREETEQKIEGIKVSSSRAVLDLMKTFEELRRALDQKEIGDATALSSFSSKDAKDICEVLRALPVTPVTGGGQERQGDSSGSQKKKKRWGDGTFALASGPSVFLQTNKMPCQATSPSQYKDSLRGLGPLIRHRLFPWTDPSLRPHRYQDVKDLKRDTVVVNGKLFQGSIVEYDEIVKEISELIARGVEGGGTEDFPSSSPDKIKAKDKGGNESLIEHADGISRVLLHLCNRTFSGGNLFETFLEVVGNDSFGLVVPLSNLSRPLEICVVGDAASLQGHIRYQVMESESLEVLGLFDAFFSSLLCLSALPLSALPEADSATDEAEEERDEGGVPPETDGAGWDIDGWSPSSFSVSGDERGDTPTGAVASAPGAAESAGAGGAVSGGREKKSKRAVRGEKKKGLGEKKEVEDGGGLRFWVSIVPLEVEGK